MFARKDKLYGFLLILPSIIAVGIIVHGFIAWSVRVSFSKWKGLTPDYTFVGLRNYLDLFADPRFHVDIRNTVVFTVVFVLGALGLGVVPGDPA
jgi:glucose/mannose transport system permease protein